MESEANRANRFTGNVEEGQIWVALEFRWRPPQTVKPWTEIRDASQYGLNCAQAGWGAAPGTISEGSSEDGLYLNIWKPRSANPGANLPVMVWIHGGAFVFGSGSQPDFSGIQFAKQGVILITFNYRLGRLGFFAFPALSKELFRLLISQPYYDHDITT